MDIRQFIKDQLAPRTRQDEKGNTVIENWYNPRHWNYMDWSNVATVVSVGLYIVARAKDKPRI